jgi:hypothetical protein
MRIRKPRIMKTAVPGAILLFLLAFPAWGEVTLIRKIPDSGQNQVDARWSKPRPQTEQIVGQAELSARIILGGQGGGDAAGEPVHDLYTDSTLSLAQPLGSTAVLNIGASALRKRHLDGREQSYNASVDLTAERWSLDLNGSYGDSARSLTEASGVSTVDVDKETTDLLVASTLNASFIPTLPMSLSYQHSMSQDSEDGSSIEDTQSDSADLLAQGTLGTVGLELGGSVEHSVDGITDVETFGAGGNLELNFPLLPFLHLRPGVAPLYSRTDYLNGDYNLSTTLDADLGFYFPLSEAFELRLVAGIANTWSSERVSGTVTDHPSQATWQGETGVEWQPESGYFTSAAYSLSSSFQSGAEPNQAHQGDLSLGWRNPREQGTLQNVEAGTDFSMQFDDTGELESADGHWSAGVDLQPVKTMSLSSSYSGSIDKSETPVVLTHQLESELSHAPDPLLNYQLAASVEDSISEEVHSLTADGLGQVTLLPQWNLKVYTVSLGENLAFSRELPEAAEPYVVAKTFSSVAIPLASFLKVRYDFTWEWVNQISEGGASGNAFQHLAGLTLAGDVLPFSLTTEYQIGHGFRGVRHDLNADLEVPFNRGFGLKGEASFSRYTEEGATVSPFLFGLHGVYEY